MQTVVGFLQNQSCNQKWQNGTTIGDLLTRVDRASGKTKYVLEPIGYGHPGGKDGEIVRNLSVLSTALEIIPLPIPTIRSIPNG